mmetsp:Transcript_38809/g.62659  ORF Transcript_38809/g.62659 Transcript_38809/m.62659 type:complete len:82 (-) Transcript_38809:937-1182(-)
MMRCTLYSTGQPASARLCFSSTIRMLVGFAEGVKFIDGMGLEAFLGVGDGDFGERTSVLFRLDFTGLKVEAAFALLCIFQL